MTTVKFDRTTKFTCYDLSKFDEKVYFDSYDIYIESNENFDNEPVVDSKYKLLQYTISDTKKQLPSKYFFVSREILTEDEIKKLLPYCQCAFCTTSFVKKIIGLAPCPCCVGCMGGEIVQDHVIKKTRLYYENYNNRSWFSFLASASASSSCE